MGSARNEFGYGAHGPRNSYQPQGEEDYVRMELIKSDIPDSEKWLDVRGVELYLRISKRTVYRLAARGTIPYVRIGRRYRFNKRALDNAITIPSW
jgi:excisionase family DNA binding protein